MCGIAGVLEFDRSHRADPDLLRQMCRTIEHRGPDDEGVFVDGNIGLGMRRLSIIDLATGHQPLSNEDGSVWIVFNGEIYNQSDLRRYLVTKGHIFRSNSDTEVIVHLYEEFGRDCLQQLNGMFAFAIWDSKLRQLFLCRDRLGIKPLYYHASQERIIFSSEIKALFAYKTVLPEFCRKVLPEYLAFGYLSGRSTFYEGIYKLMPGHWLAIDEEGKADIQEYWNLPAPADETHNSESYYVQSYRELLEQAVHSHLMSDVPLGVFLSGGLDSSAVAALTTRAQGSPIETFSVGYAEEKYSELPHARAVSRHLNSIHHEVLVDQQQFFDALPKLIWHEDEPIAWPSSVALYFVARLAQQRVKVVLTGEGSDETLGGYSRYAFTLKNLRYDRIYRQCLPSGFRANIRTFISESALMHASIRRKLSHTFLARDGQSWEIFYFDNFFSAFSQAEQVGLLHKELADELGLHNTYANVLGYWEASSGDTLRRLLHTDIKTYLVELLMKQDNMSMAASIESRVPFLDHKLVEFALQIPPHFQIDGFAGKNILKKAMRGLLPDSIIYGQKLGFPTPWNQWLSGPQLDAIRDLLLSEGSLNRRLFSAHALERLFDEHQKRHRDHADRIWRLLNLELWQRVCIESSDSCPELQLHSSPSN